MKITALEIENVKRIGLIRLEPGPDGSMVVIGGDNAQGKTSLLDSIEMGIAGGSSIPARPIRDGSSKAKIILETEEFKLTRTFTAKGSQLVIENPDRSRVTSPQTLLDSLTSRVSFDPLAFTRMDDKKQLAELQRLVGIDFSELDKEFSTKYADRTAKNRDVKSQQARVDAIVRYPNAPKEKVNFDELTDKLNEASQANEANAKLRLEAESIAGHITALKATLQTRQEEFAKAKLALDTAQHDVEEAEEVHEAVSLKVDKLKDEDTAGILEQIRTAEETNLQVAANATWKLENETLVRLTREATTLTDRLAKIEEEKETRLGKAKFPVDGLGFSSDGVTFNGVPFSQASAAEQLRVSVAMGFALQPKLKIALIRDGSLLDDHSLALVAKLAEEQGGQVWIERVGQGAECSVILEAGEVKENRLPAAK